MKIPNKKELQQVTSNHSSAIDFKDLMNLYKDYTRKEKILFLVRDTTLPPYNPLTFEKGYYKMTVSEKVKLINNKIE